MVSLMLLLNLRTLLPSDGTGNTNVDELEVEGVFDRLEPEDRGRSDEDGDISSLVRGPWKDDVAREAEIPDTRGARGGEDLDGETTLGVKSRIASGVP